MTNAGIFHIIVSKFNYRKKLGLFVLFVIDKKLEIDLHHTVMPIGLAIHLRVKSSKEPLFDVKEIA